MADCYNATTLKHSLVRGPSETRVVSGHEVIKSDPATDRRRYSKPLLVRS